MPSESTSSTTRLIGDRYELITPIGRGGMGRVWRARDTLLERDVAVKEIEFPPGVSDDERDVLRLRVMREARAAARLGHPSVVTVYDVVQENDEPFIVMELVDAPSLADILRQRGPVAHEQAARIGLDVLGALMVAHEAGVVHRDIKPANVIVRADGHAELADFGIASVKDDPSVTSTGFLLGSPAYMAPEQASRGLTSPASDLWSLGATLYFAVEGAPPFAGDGALPTMSAVLTEEPRAVSRPGPLATLVRALLDKDPARRPTHAQVRELLERAATEVPAEQTVVLVDPYPQEPSADDTHPKLRRKLDAPPAAAVPAPATQPVRRDRSPRGLPLVAGLLVVLALMAAAVYAFQRIDDGSPSGATDGSAASQPAVVPGATQPKPAPKASARPSQAQSSSSSQPSQSASTSAAASAPAKAASSTTAPTTWTSYAHGRTGYQLKYPQGWTVTEAADHTDFKDPATGTYLRLAWTGTPGDDAAARWKEVEKSFRKRHAGYRRITIAPTRYQGFPAAIWEFTYGTSSRLHAVDLGFVTGRYGFALNFQTAESRWQQSQPTFDAFKASFQPPR